MQKLTKTIPVILFLMLSITLVNAQNKSCTCKENLEFLNKKVKKTPSYKKNKTVYKDQFLKLEKNIENLNSAYECYVQLNKLMLSLTDNHSRLYSADKGAGEDIKNDVDKLNAFKSSKLFTIYPRPNIDLDSLKIALESKPKHAIEGVYSRTDYMTLGVYKMPDSKEYRAVVLKSENELWEIGEVLYTLIPFGNNYLLAVGGSLGSKRMVAHTERIKDGVFLTLGFQKDPSQANYSVSLYPKSTYFREELSPEITYLKIGSFSSWNPKLSQAEEFYKSLEGTLTKKNLILDLRDNGGGGNRNSNLLLKILKDYLKKNNVFVIINNRTASNAEQFAYKLSAFDNCKSFGNRTNGTAAYEVVNATYNTPCGNFLIILTSKKHSKFLKLESEGLAPDVTFAPATDWMLELQNLIEAKK